MKTLSIIRKSLREQLRHYWILILTVSLAPFFVFIYYLINEASKPHYNLVVVNLDRGVTLNDSVLNYGDEMIRSMREMNTGDLNLPLSISHSESRAGALELLQQKKEDALIVIPEDFSLRLQTLADKTDTVAIRLEIAGDLTSISYMVTAIWGSEFVSRYLYPAAGIINPICITETPLGTTGNTDGFSLYMPGILILSVIMLMFSATIAFITEIEQKTMIRLKLSRMTAPEFLAGISVVQTGVGILAALFTLGVALSLGFTYAGSYWLMLLIVILASISIIAFSLILAAMCRTVTEVLIIGNFPMFLFMFFTGAAFPIEGLPLFTIAGYPITLQGLMSPVHAISALKKVLIFGMGLREILPELVSLVVITILYFLTGMLAFRFRHMRAGK